MAPPAQTYEQTLFDDQPDSRHSTSSISPPLCCG